MTSPVRISSAGMLSMPGDLPIFSELIAVPISCLRIGSCGFLFSLMTLSTEVSPVTGWLYSSVQYAVHLLIIASSSMRQFPFLSWIVLTFLSVVRSLTTLYDSLLLCLIKLFSISEHFIFIHNYLASCMACLMVLLHLRYPVHRIVQVYHRPSTVYFCFGISLDLCCCVESVGQFVHIYTYQCGRSVDGIYFLIWR